MPGLKARNLTFPERWKEWEEKASALQSGAGQESRKSKRE